jgi:hypothetical protein
MNFHLKLSIFLTVIILIDHNQVKMTPIISNLNDLDDFDHGLDLTKNINSSNNYYIDFKYKKCVAYYNLMI